MDLNAEMQQKILEWIETGEALVSDQLPVIIHQIIAYGWAVNIVTLVVSVAIMLVCINPFRVYRINNLKYLKKREEGKGNGFHYNWFWDGNDVTVPGVLSMIIGGIIGFCISCRLMFGVIPTILKLWLAPNLYIIEYLKYLT
jgi:hypothetical protein